MTTGNQATYPEFSPHRLETFKPSPNRRPSRKVRDRRSSGAPDHTPAIIAPGLSTRFNQPGKATPPSGDGTDPRAYLYPGSASSSPSQSRRRNSMTGRIRMPSTTRAADSWPARGQHEPQPPALDQIVHFVEQTRQLLDLVDDHGAGRAGAGGQLGTESPRLSREAQEHVAVQEIEPRRPGEAPAQTGGLAGLARPEEEDRTTAQVAGEVEAARQRGRIVSHGTSLTRRGLHSRSAAGQPGRVVYLEGYSSNHVAEKTCFPATQLPETRNQR